MNILVTDYAPVMKFELTDPATVSEEDFQEDVIRILGHLYPDDWVFRFHPRVEHDGVGWKPDLALVDKLLRFWFVIEVEIANHSLEKHVLPQVSAFVQGSFGNDCLVSLSNAIGITTDEAATLVHLIPRQVAVISNKPDDRWTTKLASEGVQHLAVSSFRNLVTGQLAHRITGALEPPCQSVAFGIVHARDGAIVTDASKVGDFGEFGATSIYGFARWQTVLDDGRAWLIKESGPIGFPDKAYVQILRRDDGGIEIRMPYQQAI